jgi:site-specific recombinase XerD
MTTRTRKPRVVHEALTTEEMRRLATPRAIGDPRAVGYRRNRMIFDLMISTGLRSCEVVTLTRTRVDLDAGRIWVAKEFAKSGTGRPVWLGPSIRERLGSYLETIPDDQELLFPTRRGRVMDTRKLRELFDKVAKRTQIEPKRLHPHALRHTYAIRYLEAGGSLPALRDQLGHSDIETTAIYLRSASRTQAEEAARLDL